MSFQVVVRGLDVTLPVEMGETILATALARGVAYPHGCRSGNCGACKSRLHSGEVEMSPYSEYALTESEKDQGLILACRAVPWEDCEVEPLDQEEVILHPQRRMQCTVVGLVDHTHDIKGVRLRIEAGGPYTFSAGQYASVTFAGQAPRDYSMATRPDEAELEFHIRRMGRGGASDFVYDRLQVGDAVRVDGPFGTAYLRDRHRGPILAVAGGSGLAPIKSIVEEALHQGLPQPIHLYLGVRAERDLYLVDHFRALAARHETLTFTPVLSEPAGPTTLRTGYVGEVAVADHPDIDGWKAYMAGPPVMVETTTALLKARGLASTDIHADAFYTEEEKAMLEAAS